MPRSPHFYTETTLSPEHIEHAINTYTNLDATLLEDTTDPRIDTYIHRTLKPNYLRIHGPDRPTRSPFNTFEEYRDQHLESLHRNANAGLLLIHTPSDATLIAQINNLPNTTARSLSLTNPPPTVADQVAHALSKPEDQPE